MRVRNGQNLVLKVRDDAKHKLAGSSFIVRDFDSLVSVIREHGPVRLTVPKGHKMGDLILEAELLGVQKP